MHDGVISKVSGSGDAVGIGPHPGQTDSRPTTTDSRPTTRLSDYQISALSPRKPDSPQQQSTATYLRKVNFFDIPNWRALRGVRHMRLCAFALLGSSGVEFCGCAAVHWTVVPCGWKVQFTCRRNASRP